jgi:hypothetical protein
MAPRPVATLRHFLSRAYGTVGVSGRAFSQKLKALGYC